MADKNLVNHGRMKEVLIKLWTKANEKFVKTIEFVEQTDSNDGNKRKKKIKFTKGNDLTTTLDPFLVTEWNDLQYTTKRETTTLNLFNYASKTTGVWWGGGNSRPDAPSPSAEHSVAYVDINRNKVYTILKKHDDGANRVFFLTDDNVRIAEATYSGTLINGWYKYTIPASHTNAADRRKITIQFKHEQNGKEDIMVFEGDFTPQANQQFIPYTGKPILIDSREVSLSYSNDTGALSSKTIHDAIDELGENSVMEWGDLDYTHKRTSATHVNIYDKNTHVTNGIVYSIQNGINQTLYNVQYDCAFVPCVAGKRYTILKKASGDYDAFGVYENGTTSANGQPLLNIANNYITIRSINGYHHIVVEIPTTQPLQQGQTYYLAVNLKKDVGNRDVMMVFEDELLGDALPTGYIPHYTGSHLVFVDSSKVALTFDKGQTNLTSTTISDAIHELYERDGWERLDYVDEYPFKNILDLKKRVLGGYYNTGGFTVDKSWSTVNVDIKNNVTYTIMRKDTGSNHAGYLKLAYLNNAGAVQTVRDISFTVGGNGWKYCTFTSYNAGTNNTYPKVGISIQETNPNYEYTMILEGDATGYADKYIPFGKKIKLGLEINQSLSLKNMDTETNTLDDILDKLLARVGNLEAVKKNHTIGEIITVSYADTAQPKEKLIIGSAEYIYCGKTNFTDLSNRLLFSQYSELGTHLEKNPDDIRFIIPHVSDIVHSFSNSKRAHYICAKIGADAGISLPIE